MTPLRLLAVVATAAVAVTAAVYVMNSGDHPADATVSTPASPVPAAAPAAANPAEDALAGAPSATGSESPERSAVAAPESAEAALPSEGVSAAAESTRTVSGRVVDASGRPIAGAEVGFRFGGFALHRDGVSIASDERKTGADGRFALTAPKNDAKTLYARTARHLDQEKIVGPSNEDVDVGDLTLELGATIVGRVLDEVGNPVAKAKVTAFPPGKSNGAPGLIVLGGFDSSNARSTLTDAKGGYEIGGLPEGDVTVSAGASGFTTENKKAVKVDRHSAPPEVNFALSRGASIAGYVTDARDAPLPNVRVRLMDTVIDLSEPGVSSTFGQERSVATGADGSFVFEGLKDAVYDLSFELEGHLDERAPKVAAGADDVRVRMRDSGVLYGVVRDARTNKPIADVDVAVSASNSPFGGFRLGDDAKILRGKDAAKAAGVEESPGLFAVGDLRSDAVRVELRADGYAPLVQETVNVTAGQSIRFDAVLQPELTISGVVLDPKGAPVEGATVRAENGMGNEEFSFEGGRTRRRVVTRAAAASPGQGPVPLIEGEKTAVTDADGRFSLRGLAAGSYRLQASHPLHAVSEPETVSLEDDQPLDELEISLRAGGTLAGRAFDADGAPLPGARVYVKQARKGRSLFGGDDDGPPPGFGMDENSTTTDSDGRYRIQGILPGNYLADVERPSGVGGGSTFLAMAMDGAPETGTPITIEEGKETTADLSLPPTGSLSGVVTEAGRPVSGARVSLTQQDGLPFGAPSATTDAQGRYAIDEVAPGKYVFEVTAPQAGLPIRKDFVVQARQAHVENVTLPSGVISGRVTLRSTGAGVEDITLEVSREDRKAQDDAGERRPRRAIAVIAMSTGPGGATTMRFGNDQDVVRTDANGNYEIRHLEPGDYKVRIRGAGVIPQDREHVRVAAGKGADGVNFAVDMGAVLKVLVDGGGEDVPFVRVSIAPEATPGEERTEVEGGNSPVNFDGLGPGRYLVKASSAGREGSMTVEISSGENKTVTIPIE